MIRLSVLSSETIRLPYAQVDANGDLDDPTGSTPYFAVVALDTDPTAPDWNAGTWETSTDNLSISLGFQIVQSPYKARYTIDGTALTAGTEYHLWYKLGNYVAKLGKVEVT
jgi:hypothetical protein